MAEVSHKLRWLGAYSSTISSGAGSSASAKLQSTQIQTINIAGPRASREAGVAEFTREVLVELLRVLA